MQINFIPSQAEQEESLLLPPISSKTKSFIKNKKSSKVFPSTKASSYTLDALKSDGRIFTDCLTEKKFKKATIVGAKLCGKAAITPCVSPVRYIHKTYKNFSSELELNDDFHYEQDLTPIPTNEREDSLYLRISNCRDLIQQGTFEADEIYVKKKKFSADLKEANKNKGISEQFYKEAKEELKKFDDDLLLGAEERFKNLERAYEVAKEMNQRSLEFYAFVNDNNLKDSQESINTVVLALIKIEHIYRDRNLSENRKQSSIFSCRGHEYMETEQSDLIEDLKHAAYKGTNREQRKEIDRAILTIKKYLTHDLKEAEVHPEKDEVLSAYSDLEKVLKTPRDT